MTWLRALAVVGILVAGAVEVFGHSGGEAVKPASVEELWSAWEWDPATVICLVSSGWLYAIGLRRLWGDTRPGVGIRFWEAGCFAAGWVALVIALLSPLHPWGRVLFAAHMTQHEILMLVAAPLMILGRPMIAFLKALPPGRVQALRQWTDGEAWRRGWNGLTHPFTAWLVHGVVLWVWHVPVLFEATVDDELVHALQHLSFFLSALLFWWAAMHGRHKTVGYGMAVLYLFTTAVHSGVLGALIAFARTLIYPVYSDSTQAWGLTPMEDQQLGGLIMWVPAALTYLIAGGAFIAGWMRESERRVRAWESEASRKLQV